MKTQYVPGYNTSYFTSRSFGTKTTAFNIATKPIDNLDDIYKSIVIKDNKVPYNYFRATSANRLIICGEDINFIPDIYMRSYVIKAIKN